MQDPPTSQARTVSSAPCRVLHWRGWGSSAPRGPPSATIRLASTGELRTAWRAPARSRIRWRDAALSGG